jgi:hypothetical protein
MTELVKGIPKVTKSSKILDNFKPQKVEKEDLIKAALLVQLNKQLKESLKTSYHLPSEDKKISQLLDITHQSKMS